MTEEEYNHLRLKIRERAELESFYIINELEKFRKHNTPPCIPPSPLESAIMDYIVYGTDIAKENVLRLL